CAQGQERPEGQRANPLVICSRLANQVAQSRRENQCACALEDVEQDARQDDAAVACPIVDVSGSVLKRRRWTGDDIKRKYRPIEGDDCQPEHSSQAPHGSIVHHLLSSPTTEPVRGCADNSPSSPIWSARHPSLVSAECRAVPFVLSAAAR